MTYMVVECHPGYAVVLSEDGQFLKVADKHYTIGQVVREVTPMRPPVRRPGKWIYSLAAVAACLALLFTVVLPVSGQPYASVYVKINPEIRIDVDKHDRVVALEGINPDGIALIADYDFRHKHLEQVTDELVDLAITGGFLQADGQITLTLDSEDQLWVTDHCKVLSDHVHAHLQDRFSVTVQVSLQHENHHPEHDGESLPAQSVPGETDHREQSDHHWDDDDDWDGYDDDDDDDRFDDDDDDDDNRHDNDHGHHHDD